MSLSSDPHYQKIVPKTVRAVRKALVECNGNETSFLEQMATIKEHYTGNHSSCTHDLTGKETIITDGKLKKSYLVCI